MRIETFPRPWLAAPTRPIRAAAPAPLRERLESTPVPPDSGLRSVDARQGSLAYQQGSFRLRDRLLAARVELIGLRHGESEANAANPPVLSGQSETPLTERGRQQAAGAAEQLYQNLGGDEWVTRAAADPSLLPVVYSSPLSRAADTAAALATLIRERSTALGTPVELPIHSDARLLEIGLGEYEMQPAARLVREHPTFAANFDSGRGQGIDFQHRFPGGESRLDTMGRVSSMLDEVAVQNPGRKVLLVCHQETLVAIRTALGLSKQRDGRIRADAQEIQNAVPLPLVTPGNR